MTDADLAVVYLELLRTTELQRLAYIRQADYTSAKEVHLVMGRNVPKLLDLIESQAKRIEELTLRRSETIDMCSQLQSELTHLQEVLEKLHKTKDGKYVVPKRDWVYYLEHDGDMRKLLVYGDNADDGSGTPTSKYASGRCTSDCFFTREAAYAAAAKGESDAE